MTQIQNAKNGIITKEMEIVASKEGMTPDQVRELVAAGKVVIPANINHKNLDPAGIGKGMKTKINANIGTSGDFDKLADEIAKMEMVIEHKADSVMDLSTGGDITEIRKALIEKCTIPFGNVPIYQMIRESDKIGKSFMDLTVDDMFSFIEEQAENGVDYMTIHAGLTRSAVEKVKAKGRIGGIVSRGGSMMTAWMLHNEKENPFYEYFDRLCEICRVYDVTLSLGDGLRPGAIADGTDWGQVEELLVLAELVKRSRDAGVQVMVEGPGHLPIDQVEMNIKLQKSLCDEAPFYVLGPLVTDIAAGYDHITSAIGGAIAGTAGADFLCYVTPAEHLGLPDSEDVREGIIAARIAAHVADIGKKIPGAFERDLAMSKARKALDWEEQAKHCIDPVKFNKVREERKTSSEACSMCGDLCVYKVLENKI